MSISPQPSIAKRVLSGSAWILGTQGLVLVLALLAQRIILSTLTKEELGTLAYERRMTDLIVGIIVDFGMNGIIIRRVVQHPERAQHIISSAIAFRLVMWIVATAASAGYALASGYSVVDVMIWSLYLLIAARTTMLRYAVEAPYRTSSRFHVISILGVVDALLFTFLIYLFRTQLSPLTVIEAYALAAIPGFTILVLLDKGRFIRPSFVKWTEIKTLVRESIPVISAVALVSLHAALDTILLEWYGTKRDLGVLAAIYASIGPFLVILPQAVSLTVMPEIARLGTADIERRSGIILTIVRLLVVLTVLIVSIAGPCLPAFIQLVSNGRYSAEHIQFFWFLWTAPFVAILIFSQELAITMGQQRYNMWLAVGLLAFTIVFGFALIPMLNSYGAVLARLATLVAGAGICFVVLRRIVGEHLDLFLVLRICVVIAIGMVSTTWLSSHMSVSVAIIGSVASALVASVVMGLLVRSDIRFVNSLLGRSL
ncbi:MAG: polysaccharide biosynthesis C-terminal domain-containing protein [Candidatus Kapabacteria bacterium]|nr:polysaccharide biosynthesis C-terminal domain-containing protein [Candidatus Kapabacteria bacterium]